MKGKTVHMSSNMWTYLKEMASKEGRTVNNYIRKLVTKDADQNNVSLWVDRETNNE